MSSYIYIIFGASGSGKSTLLHEIRNSDIKYSINTKLTNRVKRDYDEDEIETTTGTDITSMEFYYSRYGNLYSINNEQIENAIKANENHFVICNDIATILKLKDKFGQKIKVIFLSFDAPRKTITEIIKTKNISDDELNLRLQKIDVLYNEFRDNREIFDYVILNKFGAPPSYMMSQLRRILQSDSGNDAFFFRNIQNELLNVNNKISDLETAIINSSINIKSEAQTNYVFIVMAMSEDHPELIDVLNTIKRSCKSLNKIAERIDDYVHKNEITEKMLGCIKTAEYIVADLTYSRPNVYYELGYAHAYGKDVIITAKTGTTLHFDIRNYQVLFYNTLAELEDKLKIHIEKYEKERNAGANSTYAQ